MEELVQHTKPDIIIIPGDLPTSLDLPVLLYSYIKGGSRGEYIRQLYQRFTKRISYRQIRTSKRILGQLEDLGLPVLLIHGNTETSMTISWLELYSRRKSNFHWISDRAFMFDGILFVGHGFIGVPSNYHRVRSPGEIDHDEDYRLLRFAINRAKIEYPEYTEVVLVSHAPPHNTKIDYLKHKRYHGGSINIRRVLDEGLVDRVISGHLHESFGLYENKKWWAINAGAVIDDIACTVDIRCGDTYWYRNVIRKPSLSHLVYSIRNRLSYDRYG